MIAMLRRRRPAPWRRGADEQRPSSQRLPTSLCDLGLCHRPPISPRSMIATPSEGRRSVSLVSVLVAPNSKLKPLVAPVADINAILASLQAGRVEGERCWTSRYRECATHKQTLPPRGRPPGEPEAEHDRCCDGRLTTPLNRKEGANFARGLCDAEQR
jgi:hypothetical protein